jgi:hypothetical protein
VAAPGSVTLFRLQVALGSSRFSFNYLLFLKFTMQRPSRRKLRAVKGKILMLVVLGSRLAISCVLNHQSSSGSSGVTNFLFRCSRLSVNETDVVGVVIIKFREPERGSSCQEKIIWKCS